MWSVPALGNPFAGSPDEPDRTVDETEGPAPEWQLAIELLTQESGLWSNILYRLLGCPRRYSDLKPLLENQAENTLTYGLEKLSKEGLVKRKSSIIQDELVKTYQITNKGIDTFLNLYLIDTMGRISEPISSAWTLHDPASISSHVLGPPFAPQGLSIQDFRQADPPTVRGPWSRNVTHLILGSGVTSTQKAGRTYHVLFDAGRGQWRVLREGAERAARVFEEVHLAVSEALEKAGIDGRVFIHNEGGDVEAIIDIPNPSHASGERQAPPSGRSLPAGITPHGSR